MGPASLPARGPLPSWLRLKSALAVLGLIVVAGCSGSDASSGGGSESAVPSASSSSAPLKAPTEDSSEPDPTTDEAGVPEAVVPSAAALEAAESDPVEDPLYPATSNPEIDVLHYFLALDWDGATLSGRSTVTFRATRATRATETVRLDLADALTVAGVSADGEPIELEQKANGLLMQTGPLASGSMHTLVIDYAGEPQSTPAPSARPDLSEGLGWNVDADGSVYTFQEPYGAFTWYPVNDHPSDEALYDVAITTRDGNVGVFNGVLQSSDTADGEIINRWHVEDPTASYLTTLAIGPYRRHVDTTSSGTDISYWFRPVDKHVLPELRSQAVKAFEWAERHLGPYPFDSLGYVVVGGTSAMETQTLITISAQAAGRSDAVVLHELSHQWFGDSVTLRDWTDLWLNEGWAMYAQQWYETDTGQPQYAGGLSQWRSYDAESRHRSGPPGDYEPDSFGDINVYLGPALMLDRIRQRIGDDEFEHVVKAWPAEHAGQTVDRETFTTWINEETGKDLTALIDEWLDSPQTPR